MGVDLKAIANIVEIKFNRFYKIAIEFLFDHLGQKKRINIQFKLK